MSEKDGNVASMEAQEEDEKRRRGERRRERKRMQRSWTEQVGHAYPHEES